jgi:hypothetical protein
MADDLDHLDAAPEAPETPEAPPPRWKLFLRQRLPRVVLLVGLGIIIIRTLAARPSEVEVVYHYDSARQGLVRAQMVYLQQREEVRRVLFDYGQAGAEPTQAHRVELTDGEYAVILSLTYKESPPRPLFGGRATPTPTGGTLVELRRPLVVRGKGRLSIYLAGDE